jgi:hypothetical protein
LSEENRALRDRIDKIEANGAKPAAKRARRAAKKPRARVSVRPSANGRAPARRKIAAARSRR